MWMSFNRSFVALAATHDLSEVLDPQYAPPADAEENFQAKNTFMYSVFTFSLITPKSKVALRSHEATRDAQKVYADLLQTYADGTTADLTAEQLENQLRSMKLDSNWNKQLETFLHLWTTRLHDLESVRDESVSESDRRCWFTTSIKHHPQLYQGITTCLLYTSPSPRDS